MKKVTTQSAIWALLLSIPVPTLGVWFGMFLWPGTAAGDAAFSVAKCWVLAFPIVWFLLNSGKVHWPPINSKGLGVGILSGIAMAAIIFAAYFLIGAAHIDPTVLQNAMQEVGLFNPTKYLLLAAYWTFANALLEEYFWRWFVVSRAQTIMPKLAAIVLSALGFIAHHLLAMSLYFDWFTAILACVGIFVAGVFWSFLYLRYQNLLPAYISHIFADAAIFGIGYYVLFM